MTDPTTPMKKGVRVRIRSTLLLSTALIITAGLAGCVGAEPNPRPTPTDEPVFDIAAAKAHCEESGGTVQQRQPMSGTNASDAEDWTPLGEPVEVCRFQTLDEEYKSRIYADLATVWSEKPTLAALAYLTSPPAADSVDGASPASALCVANGGAISYGSGMSGGGLVDLQDPDDEVVGACVFADGSFVDEWGIAYHASGEIRGIDLTEVFRFDQVNLPDITFGE